jgi:hypothetical protein|tara:strand:+ start:142 stop:405 length:264 start_codon:yes stop_codon:yes gene_type:complete
LTFEVNVVELQGTQASQMTITTKFKKDINTLQSAVAGDFFLDVKNPKLYKKIRKFYENSGVVFSGDPLDDYDILIDYLAEDLNEHLV